jgi:hypothetical protein
MAFGFASPFRVVIAYDDFTSGKRAMSTVGFLEQRMARGTELRTSMWKFDVLRSAKLHQMAVEDAVEADVIIVASAQNGGLSEEARSWVNGWVAKKRGQTAALIALLDFTGENMVEPAFAYSFLQGAAARARIDFLPQEIRPTGANPPALSMRAFSKGRGRSPGLSDPNPPPPQTSGLKN